MCIVVAEDVRYSVVDLWAIADLMCRNKSREATSQKTCRKRDAKLESERIGIAVALNHSAQLCVVEHQDEVLVVRISDISGDSVHSDLATLIEGDELGTEVAD